MRRGLRHASNRPLFGKPLIPLDSTVTLIGRIRAGDAHAREQLLARYLPVLRGWARGRLPRHSRGFADTDDVVQLTLVRAVGRLDQIRIEREGDFLAYLRAGVLNAIREEIRRAANRREAHEPGTDVPSPERSLLERVIGRETVERYERALLQLDDAPRTAVILRIEFGMSFAEIAEATAAISAEATRKSVARALLKLAEAMREQ